MPQFTAPVRDFQFLLHEWLKVTDCDLPGFEEIDEGLVDSLLQEGGRFCEEVLFPLNQSGDQEGCNLKDGKVTLPSGFVDAYKAYCESGWPSFTCDTHYGGQGLPEVINMPMIEMICSANLSFGMLPGLSHGAYNAIHKHATQELKYTYLPKITSGEWAGVMCLTEPQCGTDLGLIRTKAEPKKDGSYAISGTKIFISDGEQDATDNIVHLVLAKLPDAPPGVKGISLFLVPKKKVKQDGTLGQRNGVTCGSIEHKMGIHGSPTCVMNYDNAKGWLVGEKHKGLRAMFTMMNEARLYVGVQGLGLSEVSYQNALAYAKERIQGRALKGAAFPKKAADPIIVHPDVRRMLLTMRAFNEGARALTLYTALQIDTEKRSNDERVKQEADDFVQLATPIIKAYFTDMGFENTNLGMQIYGGHGYVKEYGMEQYVRDARIAQIYEGANGIQALDLVGRKLSKHTGRYLRSFFHPATEFVAAHRDNPDMAEFTKALHKAIGSAQNASMWIAVNGLGNPDDAAAGSVEYLRLLALAILGYIWSQLALLALEKLKDDPNNSFYKQKLGTARFFMHKMLPQHYSLLASIVAGSNVMMEDIV